MIFKFTLLYHSELELVSHLKCVKINTQGKRTQKGNRKVESCEDDQAVSVAACDVGLNTELL